jgi:hypothetical protein
VSSITESTHKQKLHEWLEKLTHVAYHEGPVSYETVAELHDMVVIAIADGDMATLDQLQAWFIMLPTENFAYNATSDRTDLSDIRDLLGRALKLVVSPEFIAELKRDSIKRRILELVSIMPATTQQISSVYKLDENEVHAAATRLRASGCLQGKMEDPQDPGYTWTITARGQRAYEALYR